jgi:predicted RNase H-like HicB family nuclease
MRLTNREGHLGKPDQIELKALVHEEDGMYWAEVPSHPGLFASGETIDELVEAIGEAWLLYTSSEQVDRREMHIATQSLNVLVPA